jgi:hypothetical protein
LLRAFGSPVLYREDTLADVDVVGVLPSCHHVSIMFKDRSLLVFSKSIVMSAMKASIPLAFLLLDFFRTVASSDLPIELVL